LVRYNRAVAAATTEIKNKGVRRGERLYTREFF
jgi:hypothetical protein